MQKGVIQNEDCIAKVLFEDREFILICKDEKDATSKRVSLYNARKRLSAEDQNKLVVRKECLDGQWVVRILKEKRNIMEVVNGELVPFIDLIELSSTSKDILKEMLSKGINEEVVVDTLVSRGEDEDSVREEIKRNG